MGWFIRADRIIDNRSVITQNLFAYCGNNHVNYADPAGHAFGWMIGEVLGGILGGLTAVATGKSIEAGICAPIAVAGGALVNNAFDDLAQGGINTLSKFIAEWAIGTNINVMQTSVEYIIPLFTQ